ncbi:hypothetical protein [Aquabacterium sp.]|uniref:hypothetical protein n=1 Tax=Aquabacterium sp. TaxID=1872578 RepID=UPI003D6D578B
MNTIPHVLISSALLMLGARASAMNRPPPVNEQWQKMVITASIDELRGAAIPGVALGGPILASWNFNSDKGDVRAQDPRGYVAMHDFVLTFAGQDYTKDDILQEVQGVAVNGPSMIVWASTQGLEGSLHLRSKGAVPNIFFHFFDEFGESRLWLELYTDIHATFDQRTVAMTFLNGVYVPMGLLPEPSAYCLLLAGLAGLSFGRQWFNKQACTLPISR